MQADPQWGSQYRIIVGLQGGQKFRFGIIAPGRRMPIDSSALLSTR